MAGKPVKVLMVCLGNICRSPTAEVVFRHQVASRGLDKHILVDSAGTGSWHIGHPPDARAVRAALERSYDMSALRARQVVPTDMAEFDYIYAMDRQNLNDLLHICPDAYRDKLTLFLHHGNSDVEEVPDPYYSGADGFELVLDLVEDASASLVSLLAAKHDLS
jgi:protein-tyrosine phosphatase